MTRALMFTMLSALLAAAPASRAFAQEEKAEEKAAKAEDKAEEKVEKAEDKAADKAEKAEDKADDAAEKTEEKAHKAADKATAGKAHAEKKAGGDGERPYVDAALEFLNGLARSARKGDQGVEGWARVSKHASDKVKLTIAGEHYDIDVAGKKSDVRLMKYQKLSTWREGAEIKGMLLENLEFKVGKDIKKGKGKMSMVEKDGTWTVDSITVE